MTVASKKISSIHIFMNRAPVLAGRGGIDRLFDRRGLMVTRRMVTSQVNSEKALFSGSQGSGSRSGSQQNRPVLGAYRLALL